MVETLELRAQKSEGYYTGERKSVTDKNRRVTPPRHVSRHSSGNVESGLN